LYLLYTEVGFIKSSKSEVNYDAGSNKKYYFIFCIRIIPDVTYYPDYGKELPQPGET
jgi:hypothetical protein